MLFKDLGNRLKSARMGIGMSQLEFAKKLNITDKTLRNYEKGNNITVDIIKKISETTNTDFNFLLNGKNETSIKEEKKESSTNIINGSGNIAINGNISINTSKFDHSKDIKEIIELLHYAPSGFLHTIKDKLKAFKDMSQLWLYIFYFAYKM